MHRGKWRRQIRIYEMGWEQWEHRIAEPIGRQRWSVIVQLEPKRKAVRNYRLVGIELRRVIDDLRFHKWIDRITDVMPDISLLIEIFPIREGKPDTLKGTTECPDVNHVAIDAAEVLVKRLLASECDFVNTVGFGFVLNLLGCEVQ